jgi:hypothetical protein
MRVSFLPDDRVEKVFTPQEATRLLSDIKPLMRSLIEKKRVADRIKDELERYKLVGIRTTDWRERAEYLERLAEEIMEIVEILADIGVVVRDIDMGLIDFPAERYGERVYLCWRYGEKEVMYWHRVEEGLSGRKPLKTQIVPR